MSLEAKVYKPTERPNTFASFRRSVLSRNRKNVEFLASLPNKQDHLLPEAKEFNNRFTQEELLLFRAGMAMVPRMGSLKEQGFPIPEGFVETNLEHIRDAEGIAKEYHDEYPILRDFINFGRVQIKLKLHDIGEANVAVNDRPPIGRTAQDEKAKRVEPYAGVRILRNISDPVLRQEAIQHYLEHTSKDPNNLEVQMAAFIDKVQGTVRAAQVAFNIEGVDEHTKNMIRNHLWQTVPRMQEHLSRLLVLLPTQEAREAICEIGKKEFAILEKYGPPEVAKTYSAGLDNAKMVTIPRRRHVA